MFGRGPTSLEEARLVVKRPMQELYRVVVFMLKYGIVREMRTHFCLRLRSEASNIDLLQRQILRKLFPSQVDPTTQNEEVTYAKLPGNEHSIEQFLTLVSG